MDERRDSDASVGEGRLGNVAGVVLRSTGCRPEAVQACRRSLERLFEQVRVVGDGDARGDSLGLLVGALASVESERVVVVDAGARPVRPRVVLALTALPEDDVVLSGAESDACAIYRREAVLEAARRRLEAGDRDRARLLACLSVSRLAARDRDALARDDDRDQSGSRRAI